MDGDASKILAEIDLLTSKEVSPRVKRILEWMALLLRDGESHLNHGVEMWRHETNTELRGSAQAVSGLPASLQKISSGRIAHYDRD